MPFGTVAEDAAKLLRPLTLAVTCSPKHGVDHTVQFSAELRRSGHTIICHLAARMVRGQGHLDEILGHLRDADIHDVFLIGGDQQEPQGPFRRGLDLLPVLKENRNAPRTVGVPAYPEGHPLIRDAVLVEDLKEKSLLADYMITQMCFDPHRVVEWLDRMRAQGVEIPALLGVPGVVDRRRLLEISLRVGVGTSISFLRKQHGVLGQLVGRGRHETEQLYDAFAAIADSRRDVAGLHIYTFNRLVDTCNFVESRSVGTTPSRPSHP